jgi:hypothetical protein
MRAPTDTLGTLLAELVEHSAEGWIISHATMRAACVSEEAWVAIRETFPATYAYLCARTGRELRDDDAFAIIDECDPLSNERGLALWSVGQLGLWRVLETVCETARTSDSVICCG